MSKYDVKTEVTASVWRVTAKVGDQIEPGGAIMILESMKMEIPVIAEDGGVIVELLVYEGNSVVEGQVVAVLDD